jgi:hypothetical protein
MLSCLSSHKRALAAGAGRIRGPARRGAVPGAAALLLYSMSLCTTAASGQLQKIVLMPGKDSGYQLEVSAEPSRLKYFELDNPPRFVVDLYDTQLAPDLLTNSAIETVPGGKVERVRIGWHEGPRVRIVFDLKAAAAPGGLTVSTLQAEHASLVSVSFTGQPGEPAIEPASKGPSASDPVAPAVMAAGVASSAGGTASERLDADQRTRSKTLVFGKRTGTTTTHPSATPETAAPARGTSDWNLTVDRLLLESGHSSSDLGSGTNSHLQFVVGAEGALSPNWSMRLGGRIDGQYQSGDLPELRYLRFDYDETWIRYQNDNLRLTAGAQRIIWGRADEFSPTDRLSTRDFTRLVLDDLQDRRRANPAVRLQWFSGNRSLDLVYMPVFREAELPADESLWFPFDASTGAVAGLPLGDQPRAALRGATLHNDFDGNEGFGARFSDSRAGWDYALTVQRVNNPEPYFALLGAPTPMAPAQLGTVYPRTWVLGADVAVAAGAWTLRGEAAWLSDSLYTDATNFSQQTSEELNWAFGADVFPGDGDMRVTAQLSGRHLLNTQNPVDFTDVLSMVGELETPFIFNGLPWKAQLRYSFRLDETGSYINPELTFTGWEPSEIYLAAHFFDGDYGTLEGFYSKRDVLVIGWRAKF